MDYTKVPRYLIYQEKRNLEDFIENEQSLDNLMLKKIENSQIVNFPNASEYVLEIYNAAYYITTLILLQKRPLLHFSSYLNIASQIAAAPGCQNTFHQLFECTSMAMVCNYLQLLKPKQLDYSVFYNKVELWFKNYDVIYSRMFSNIVLDIMTVQKYDFYPDRFNLRPIIDALKESNKEDIFNNIEYIKARIMELDIDKKLTAIEMVFNKAEMSGKLYVADSLSTDEENVRKEMEEVLQLIGPGYSVFNPRVFQPMTEEDIDKAIAEAEKNFEQKVLTKKMDAEIEHLQNNDPINQKEPTDDGYIENLNKQLSEEKEKNAKLEERIKALESQLQPDEDFPEGMKLEIDERIIFVSAALGVTLSAKDINQTKLAQAIAYFSGDKCKSIRSRIVTLNKEVRLEMDAPGEGLSQGTLEAVKNVKEWLKKIGKTEIAPATQKLIDEIDDMYLNKIE